MKCMTSMFPTLACRSLIEKCYWWALSKSHLSWTKLLCSFDTWNWLRLTLAQFSIWRNIMTLTKHQITQFVSIRIQTWKFFHFFALNRKEKIFLHVLIRMYHSKNSIIPLIVHYNIGESENRIQTVSFFILQH